MSDIPKPAEPNRPAHANEGMKRTEPPVWPDDYDTSEQPNQPEDLSMAERAERGEVEPNRAAKKAAPKKADK